MDGCTDAVDSDCGGTETDCFDTYDNDCDGLTDSEDTADCAGPITSTTTTIAGACDYDGYCEVGETVDSCPDDCAPYCDHDDVCEPEMGETGNCSDCDDYCNYDGDCDPGEDQYSCPEDCGAADCHTHSDLSWIYQSEDIEFYVLDVGCTQDGCGEGSGSATEYQVEIRSGSYCGTEAWVWLDNVMNTGPTPTVGHCYRGEAFETEEMYPSCTDPIVIRYIWEEITCPVCDGTTSTTTTIPAGEIAYYTDVVWDSTEFIHGTIVSEWSVADTSSGYIYGSAAAPCDNCNCMLASTSETHIYNINAADYTMQDMASVTVGLGEIILLYSGGNYGALEVNVINCYGGSTDDPFKCYMHYTLYYRSDGSGDFTSASPMYGFMTDNDNDGYFSDASYENSLHDPNDANSCDPDSSVPTCGGETTTTTISGDCHTPHSDMSWIYQSEDIEFYVLDVGCTQDGCGEGSGSATEYHIELRSGSHCGEQVWVWLDNVMNTGPTPQVGHCYRGEAFETEDMYPNCMDPIVIRYIWEEITCPVCGETTTTISEYCDYDGICEPEYGETAATCPHDCMPVNCTCDVTPGVCDDYCDCDPDCAPECTCDVTPDYCDPDCDCDPDCAPAGEYGMCSDWIDNDEDGLTDCDDPDCVDDPACIPTVDCSQFTSQASCVGHEECFWDRQVEVCENRVAEDCSNGIDDDGDGMTDCDDADCDGSMDCMVDCYSITDSTECDQTEGCEWDYEYNECDESCDCDTTDACDEGCDCDPDCEVPGGEHAMCSDGIDNDEDGMTDCDDPDCGDNPDCWVQYDPCEDEWSYYYGMSCTASISGTITSSADESPVANAHVDIWEYEGGYGTMEMTDSSGNYAIDGLPDGLCYNLHVSAPDDSGLASYHEDDVCVSGAITKDIQLSAGGTITGSVTVGGTPVAYAQLDAWGPSGGGWAETGTDGTYSITGLATGTYTVSVWLEDTDYADYTATEKTVSVTAGATTSGVNFELTLGGSISGTVTYADSTPVADIRVEAWQEMQDWSSGGGGHGEAWTASDGTYEIKGLPTGTYRVEARIDDPSMNYALEPQTVTVTAGQETSGVNFVLTQGGSIYGTVTDSSGNPVANAELNAWQSEGGHGGGWAMTGSDGTYTMTGLSTGTYNVEVRAGEYSSAMKTTMVTSGQDTQLDFILTVGGSISGTVKYEDENPAVNLRVECWNEMGPGWGDSWTDTTGAYEIRGLSTGTYRVEVRIDDPTSNYASESQTVTVTAGSETTGVDFVLSAGGSISGTVTATGSPVANIRVECWKEQGSGWGDAWTATDGTYTINGLSTGSYHVMVRSEETGTNYATAEKIVSVTAGEATIGVDFSLITGGSISGTVTYGGSPLANMRVECWKHEGMGWGDAWTDSDGIYTITGLSSGIYEVEVRSDTDTGTNYASDQQTVTVVAGETTSGVDFVLTAGASISGTVTYNENPVANMRVEAWNEQGSGWGDSMTASDGTYTITGLSAGTYHVKARNDWDPTGAGEVTNYASEEQIVTLGAGEQKTGVDFALTTGGTISGTVTYNGDPVSHLRLEAHCENCEGWGEAMTSEDGTYTITGLSTGTYNVRIHTDWGSTTNYAAEEVRVSVVAGQDTPGVDFVLTTGGSISGTVIYNGEPVAHINVGAWCESPEEGGCGGGGAMTESDGTYTINGLMSGTYHVEVHSDDGTTNYASEERIVTVTAGEAVTGVDFNLTTGGSISGTVNDSNGPVPNIRVECWRENGAGWGDAWTETDGSYTIPGLSTGTYHVEIRSSESDMNYAAEEQIVSVTAGEETSGVNFVLSTGGSISGTVTDSNGPVSDVRVEAHKEMGHGWGDAWTESDGTYTITGLTSGTYRVEVRSDYAAQPQMVTVNTGVDNPNVDFVLTTGGSISGTVTAAGSPVAYIEVNAWSESGGWGGTMTASDGTYTITGLYSGIYHVNIWTEGSGQNYATAEKTVSVTAGSETTGVDFVLTTGGSISGNVTDEGGDPVPNMRVECWKEMGEGHGETMVKQDGTYTVTGLSGGIYHCTVRAQWGSTTSYSATEQTVTVTAGEETTGVNFVLTTGGSISGTVTYNQNPMLGVIVDAWSEAGWSNAMTGTDGTYTVTGLSAGTYHVSAHPFWSSTGTTMNVACEEQMVTVTAGAEVTDVNFNLTQGASISGSVTLSGEGVPYVKIEAFKEEGGGWGGTMTDQFGDYTINGLTGGNYFVEVRLHGTSYEDYSTTNQRVTLTAGEAVTGINFALESGGSISGTVTDGTSPVSYVRVEAWMEGAPGWGGAMTASDGTYSIPGLSAGIYHVEVHFGWGPTGTTYANYACEEQVVTVTAGQDTSGVDFVLTTGGSISGTVTAGTDPVQYARIEAWKEESPDWGDAWTALDGTYTLSGLTTGTYHVRVRTEGTSYSGYAAEERIVSVTAGEERSGIDFSLTQGASISGTVTAGTEAAKYVRVDAWRDWEEGETPDWGDALTASDGTYTITGLMGGKYHVNVRTEGTSYATYASLEQTVTVAAGEDKTEVDFALTQGGSISGTVTLDTAGVSYVRVWVWREGAPDWGETITDNSGSYTISGLSSGTYHVGLELRGTTYEGYTADEQQVTVTEGSDTSDIDFALTQGGSISGTVTDASGAIAGAHVEAWNDEGTGHGWERTDSNGVYTITGLPVGTYNAEVHYSDYAPQMQSEISVTAGQTTENIDFTLAEAGAISGTVTYSGSGITDLLVFAWSPTMDAFGEVLTDADGNYVIDDLPSGTDYKVKPDAEGYATTIAENVSVADGETTSGVDFVLTAGGTLSGTVTDSGGTPLEDVNINVWVPGEGFEEDWEETDEDGTYLMEGILPGTYTVEAYLTGYNPVEVNVNITEGATTEQNFTLENSSTGNISNQSIATAAIKRAGAPTASAGPDQEISLGTTLYVNAHDSTDDGTIESYAWNFGDGDVVYGVTQSHVYSTPGTYTVTLTVTDDEELTDTDTLTATVTSASSEPTANAGNDQTVDLGNTLSFDGSASSDSDGEIVSYHWDFDDASESTEIKPSHKYSTAGTYAVTLEVTDDDGLKGTDTVTISVSGQQDPVADAGPDQTINEGESVTLDASGSYDTDGTITAYEWKEGTDTLNTQSSFASSDFTVGTHTITLTVTDNDALTDTDEIIITVQAGGTIVRVTPASTTVNESQGFTINITSTETENVLGVEFILLFNKSVLQVTSVKEGTFLTSDGKNTTGSAPSHSNTAGTVTFSRSRETEDGGLTASGVIATINFNSITSGSTTLRLKNVTMRDVNGTSISLSTSNGAVTVEAVEACPLLGDYPTCGEVSLAEVVDYITLWSQGQANLADVIDLITAWAAG